MSVAALDQKKPAVVTPPEENLTALRPSFRGRYRLMCIKIF